MQFQSCPPGLVMRVSFLLHCSLPLPQMPPGLVQMAQGPCFHQDILSGGMSHGPSTHSSSPPRLAECLLCARRCFTLWDSGWQRGLQLPSYSPLEAEKCHTYFSAHMEHE
ncbi:unnamed protein product [Rangifer tarandus platyrhynchus]|uniref:Uncharacterized protein n=1 Tax=Rangifer tarandus platyrhynchus TaxID=3082113 RepID=A0AC59ZT19_RANTA